MKKLGYIILTLLLISCSSQTVQQENQNYVFDLIETDTVSVVQKDTVLIETIKEEEFETPAYYMVQIGAFSSENRAKKFAEKSRKLLNEEVIISFSDRINLYLVQLAKRFENKSEAEIVRDNLKLFPEFQDAWIVTIK